MRILVVEDDLTLSAGVCFELDCNGYLSVAAYNCKKATQLMQNDHFDLAILDVNLPDGNGFDLCRAFKDAWPELPVIFLTANDLETDVLHGFDMGAEDYVTKPFNPLELVARVKSQLRRFNELGGTAQEPKETIYKVGGLQINDDLKQVTVDGEFVKLTPIEYNILLLLMKNQGRVFSINQIYENIWNEEAVAADNTVAVHIRHIREKIEINPKDPQYLKVVWGIGYKVEKL